MTGYPEAIHLNEKPSLRRSEAAIGWLGGKFPKCLLPIQVESPLLEISEH
jgi:hypothetical protein